jgi:chromosome segregation ATPase
MALVARDNQEPGEVPRSRGGFGARLSRAFARPRPEPEPVEAEPTAEEENAAGEPEAPGGEEWLEAAVQEFERRLAAILKQAGDDLYAQIERDLAATEERLREAERRLAENSDARLEAAIAEIRLQGDAQLADELTRVKAAAEAPLSSIRKAETTAVRAAESAAARAQRSATVAASQIDSAAEKLTARARRHELKLARQENAKRIAAALARVERQSELKMAEVEAIREEARGLLAEVNQRVATAGDEADELALRLEITEGRLAETESRADAADALVEDAVARLEQSIDRVEEADRSVTEMEDRIGATAQRIAAIADTAERSVDLEGRMVAAAQTEADAAQRIREAERRLLDRIEPRDDDR